MLPWAFCHKKKVLPIVRQDENTECGLACVVMICNFHGHNLSLRQLRHTYPTSNYGASLEFLMSIFRKYHFVCRALKVPLTDLAQVKMPAMLHWNLNHFVVLKKATARHVVIHDPAVGLRKCCLKELNVCFTGVVLEVSKGFHFKAIYTKSPVSLIKLFRYQPGLGTAFFQWLGLSFVIEIMILANPVLVQYVVDTTGLIWDAIDMATLATGLIMLSLGQIGAENLRTRIRIYVTNHLNWQWSNYILLHLLQLPASFFSNRHIGDIQSRFQSIETIQNAYFHNAVSAFLASFMMGLTIIIMALSNSRLTVIVVVNLVINILLQCAFHSSMQGHLLIGLRAKAKAATVFFRKFRINNNNKKFF